MPTSTPQPTGKYRAQAEFLSVAPWPLGQAHSTGGALNSTQALKALIQETQAACPC